MRRFATLLASWTLWGLAAGASAQTLPTVSVGPSPFALRGGTLNFTVTAPAGSTVQLQGSTQPDEVSLGSAGIQFLRDGTQTVISTARVPSSGVLTVNLNIPTTAPQGVPNHVQVRQRVGTSWIYGNSVVYRVEPAAPSGPREPTAVAVTPDGRRAYVAHNDGGVVTVLDAQADRVIAELPVTVSTDGMPHKPVNVAVDPEGRHAFVSNAAATTLTVIHTASGSVSAQIPVPQGSRGLAFDYRAGQRRLYVANETANAVLVFDEAPLGRFTQRSPIPLQGSAPGPVLVLPDGRIVVGNRTDSELEVLSPGAATRRLQTATLVRVPLGAFPHGLAYSGGEILVPTFVSALSEGIEGYNRVLRIDPTTFLPLGHLFQDLGTDYRAIAALPASGGAAPVLAVTAAGSGSIVVADGGTRTVRALLELAPGDPTATPQDVAIVRDPATGRPVKLYVPDYFRDTVRPIRLDSPALAPEIALAWIGRPRVPLSGDLSDVDDGKWFFRSVNLLGSGALQPNRVTCDTCHPDGAADNLRLSNRQVPAAWGMVDTAPYTWEGTGRTLTGTSNAAIARHNHSGNPMPPGADVLIQAYFAAHQAPRSPFRNRDGTLTAAQQEGKGVFEGAGQCTQCHAGNALIPPAGRPRTISAGIGTGLVPANVPSLRGLWATAPYLHNGSARTLMDVLTINPADAHGQRAALLSEDQRRKLVEYLKTF